MRFYHIKPVDTVVFGENKSSVAGDDHEKGGKFPPEIMKLFNLGKEVKFLGIFPMKEDKIYMPMPADILGKRKSAGLEGPFYVPLIDGISKKNFFETDMMTETLPWVREIEALEKLGGYISAEAFFQKYIKHSGGKLNLCNGDIEEELFKDELRIGIAIDYSLRTVKESMLYSILHYRLKDGFVILVDGEIEKELASVGGENKVARVVEWDRNDGAVCCYQLQEDIEIKEGNLYKFYLTTHAFINCDLKACKELMIDGVKMRIKWVYSNGAEWISGVERGSGEENGKSENDEKSNNTNKSKMKKKPAILMLKPGTVFVLRALEDGKLKRIAQIADPIDFRIFSSDEKAVVEKDKFIKREWGSGVIWKI